MIGNLNDMMSLRLATRVMEGEYRSLQDSNGLSDFSSNDYLGFSHCPGFAARIEGKQQQYPLAGMGSTGSRLLSGNSSFAEELEKEIATIHKCQHALIFNSGYSANTALFSSLPGKHDTVICDEHIHASVIDGIRMSQARRWRFRHNDTEDLEKKLRNAAGRCFVVIESIYSMEGDIADLFAISALCDTYGAHLIVDEAHAFGVYGTGLIDSLGMQKSVFARIVTYGKALGLHGAAVLGSELLRDYLINFARPFIYTTAPAPIHLVALREAYQHLLENLHLQQELICKASLFKDNMPPQQQLASSYNPSPIQFVYIKGNDKALMMSDRLQKAGFDVRAIRTPTVPKGKERLRVSIHIHNDDHEILRLCHYFDQLSQK